MARAALFALLMAADSAALATAAAEAPPTTLATSLDRLARMTVDVMINGQGPFAFAVDTGAERTAVSESLAAKLGLATYSTADLHGMAGVDRVRTVSVGRLDIGGRFVEGIRAPVLPDAALGVAGLLGIDALDGLRVEMDFTSATMVLRPGGRQSIAAGDPDTLVVTARRRFGQLILAEARVGDARVYAIVDSGAQQTVGNSALRRLLARQGREMPAIPVELVSVTGRTIRAELTQIATMTIGDFSINGISIAFADAHPFRKFGIAGKPAMLIGVDTLRAFQQVSLDFATKKVRFARAPVAARRLARRDALPD